VVGISDLELYIYIGHRMIVYDILVLPSMCFFGYNE